MSGSKASEADREHFRRLGRGAGPLDDERPPASLIEMFERLRAIRRAFGELAEAGIEGDDGSEFESHGRLMERWRALNARRTKHD